MVVTDQSPDVPPWSPQARRAHQLDEVSVETPAKDDAPGRLVAPADSADLQTGGSEAGEPAPGQPRASGLTPAATTSLVAGILGGLVVALVVAVSVLASGGSAPEPAPATTVRPPQPATSAEDPAPRGTRVALGNGWTALVRGWDRNATDVVAELNPRSTLADGEQYLLIDLELSYVDGEPDVESPFFGVDLTLVTDDGTAITPTDAPCTPPEPVFDFLTELERGRAERGLICFPVDGEQVKAPQLILEPSMTYGSTPSHLGLVAPD